MIKFGQLRALAAPAGGVRLGRALRPLLVGAVGGRLIAVLCAPLLTRLYTPDDFGLLGLFTTVAVVLTPVAALRYEAAIPLPDEQGDVQSLVALTFVVALATSVLVALVLAVLVATEAVPIVNELGLLVWGWPLLMLVASPVRSLSMLATRERDYGLLGRVRLAQGIGQVGIQLGAGLAGWAPTGLVVGYAASSSLGVSVLVRSFRDQVRAATERSRAGLRETAERYRGFATVTTPSTIISSLSQTLPLALLALLFGRPELGAFVVVQRIVGIPSRIVGTEVGRVFRGEASHRLTSGDRELGPLFRSIVLRVAGLSALFFVPLAIVAPLLAEPILGDEWDDVGRFIPVAVPLFAAQMVAAAVLPIFHVLERHGALLRWHLSRIATLGIAAVVVAWTGVEATTAILIISLAAAATYAGVLLFSWRLVVDHDATPDLVEPAQ